MIAVKIETADQEMLVLDVLGRLRHECVTELTATRLEEDRDAALRGVMRDLRELRKAALMRYAICASDMTPIAILNVYRAGAVEVQFQMFSTPSWPLIAAWTVRWMRTHVIPKLIGFGIEIGDISALLPFGEHHRLELDRWFALLDCFPCGPALPRGKNGELFQHYVWRAPAIDASMRAQIRETAHV